MPDHLDFITLLLIGISLAIDCFAIAVSASVCTAVPYRHVFRVSFAFGLAQFAMPIIGWLGGRALIDIISGYDHWVAFFLLAGVGVRIIWDSFHSGGRVADVTRGILLITIAVVTSVDALAVGLSFAFLRMNIVTASATIGTVTFVVTAIGFLVGRHVGSLMGKWARLAGGLVLIGIGFRILLSHIYAL